MQFSDSQLEASSVLGNAERKKNETSKLANVDANSTFCAFLQFNVEHDLKYSAVKLEKYNSSLNCFEETSEIHLGPRIYFGVALQKNKIFVMGGLNNSVYLKSVSSSLNT